jgi:hypothetical protein
MGTEITVKAKVKMINPSREISCINLESKSDYSEDGGSRFLQNVGNYLTKLQSITFQKTVTFLIWLVLVKYCNGFDQGVARQQLCKHGTLRNNRSCISVNKCLKLVARQQSARQWTGEVTIT